MPIDIGDFGFLFRLGLDEVLPDELKKLPGWRVVSKGAEQPDVDPGDGYVDIQNIPNTKIYTFSATAAIDTISSSNAGDTGDVDLDIIKADGTRDTISVTLNGQNKVQTFTPFLAFNGGSMARTGVPAGDIYIYEDTAITDGVPDDLSTTRGYIEAGATNDAIGVYTVPTDEIAIAIAFGGGVEERTAAVRIVTQFRPPGFVDFVRPTAGLALEATGTSSFRGPLVIPRGVPAGTQLKASVSTDELNTTVLGDFTIVLVKKSTLGF